MFGLLVHAGQLLNPQLLKDINSQSSYLPSATDSSLLTSMVLLKFTHVPVADTNNLSDMVGYSWFIRRLLHDFLPPACFYCLNSSLYTQTKLRQQNSEYAQQNLL